MEIYKDLSSPASQQFEKLLNSQLSKNKIEEGKMKTIATMFSQGKSAEEIAKKMKLPVDTVKSILGEETELDEFTLSQINTLKKSYADNFTK